RELCGGTHVVHTGQLGLALIVSESGVGSGIRRVEVLAGRRAMAYLAGQLQQVHEIGSLLNVPPERAAERVRNLLEELHAARREAERLAERLAEHRAEELLGRVVEVNGVPVLASEVDARSVDELGRLHDLLRRRLPRGVIVLGAVVERQPRFVVGVSRDVLRKDFDARTLVREVAAVAGGGGGGRPEFATGGGRDVARLPEALRRALEVVASATGG
ncbi:MAG TPA: DHHA1 domain-containing protein, partial [Chloroflexota bacterium]